MSQYALRVPDSLFEAARKLAEQDNTSMNQFFVTAIAEKISALHTANLLRERALNGDLEHYHSILDRVAESPAPYGNLDLPKSD